MAVGLSGIDREAAVIRSGIETMPALIVRQMMLVDAPLSACYHALTPAIVCGYTKSQADTLTGVEQQWLLSDIAASQL